MSQKAKAVVHMRFPTDKFIALIMDSLGPEVASSSTHRSQVLLSQGDNIFTITFEAEDATALRASMNTYLRWLQLLKNIYEILES